MNNAERTRWLTEEDPQQLQWLWTRADQLRREHVGDAVHLRGLIEFTNRCGRSCLYCGLRRPNKGLPRYRMEIKEILDCARTARRVGMGTVVLQGGEDPDMPAEWLAEAIRQIKAETGLAVTISVGERSRADYELWREAGADRSLTRFETSNPELYAKLHPGAPGGLDARLAVLRMQQELGYEVGSGVLIGLPGQSYDDLAADIEMFVQLRLHMIGVGPYIPHGDTPLARVDWHAGEGRQVPNTELMGLKVLALTRIACPDTNLPATTALATVNRDGGRQHGLERGGNVVMPNLTPEKYKKLYEIYPQKAGVNLDVANAIDDLRRLLDSMGRTIGTGRGDSVAYTRQMNMPE